ncbi:hypothetical protein K3495_g13948 [Podosphaera aphanis]|nr:hypothetical protein K3495_g13948 [Podosphaera aphanis]
MLQIQRLLSHQFRRQFTQSLTRNNFEPGPAPPRLPPQEQEEFERLQKLSTGAFSTSQGTSNTGLNSSRPRPQINQSPHTNNVEKPLQQPILDAKGDGRELHPDVRKVAKPEFEGERNPVTGEIGGPKTEPIRWGIVIDKNVKKTRAELSTQNWVKTLLKKFMAIRRMFNVRTEVIYNLDEARLALGVYTSFMAHASFSENLEYVKNPEQESWAQ